MLVRLLIRLLLQADIPVQLVRVPIKALPDAHGSFFGTIDKFPTSRLQRYTVSEVFVGQQTPRFPVSHQSEPTRLCHLLVDGDRVGIQRVPPKFYLLGIMELGLSSSETHHIEFFVSCCLADCVKIFIVVHVLERGGESALRVVHDVCLASHVATELVNISRIVVLCHM